MKISIRCDLKNDWGETYPACVARIPYRIVYEESIEKVPSVTPWFKITSGVAVALNEPFGFAVLVAPVEVFGRGTTPIDVPLPDDEDEPEDDPDEPEDDPDDDPEEPVPEVIPPLFLTILLIQLLSVIS